MIIDYKNINLDALNPAIILRDCFIYILILFIYSCSGKPEFIQEKQLSEDEKKTYLTNEIKSILNTDNLIQTDSFILHSSPQIIRVYEKNNFQPFWVNTCDTTAEATLMLISLDSSLSYGLPAELFNTRKIKTNIELIKKENNYIEKSKLLAHTDILLTNAYFTYTVYLSKGFIDTSGNTVKYAYKYDSLKTDLTEKLITLNGTERINHIFNYQPRYGEYNMLRKALASWLKNNTLWHQEFNFPDFKKDSVTYKTELIRALKANNLLDSNHNEYDTTVINSFKKFQRLHALDADGKPGKHSAGCLKKSNYERYLQGVLALEKWRWKNRTADFQWRINLPSYELYILRNDSIIHKTRIVCGTPENQTPELKAKIKWITLFPFWNVPHSIATKEFLPAVQRDTSYIRKNNYKVYKTDKTPANVAEIDWKKLNKDRFPYRIVQDGGTTNSLGLIVFFFPNPYDVYCHDTPAKYLFARKVRAFSHGCIRVYKPFEVGELVMKNDRPKDTITADTLKNWALKGIEQRINLKKYIPIEVDYISVTADSTGQIFFHYDIYGRDEKYIQYLKRITTHLAKYPKNTLKKENTIATILSKAEEPE